MSKIERILDQINFKATETAPAEMVTWTCAGCRRTADVRSDYSGPDLCRRCECRRRRRAEWGETLTMYGTPPRYRVPEGLRIEPRLAAWRSDPWCVVFLGANGSGKTWGATSLFGHLLCEGVDFDTGLAAPRWCDTSWAIEQVKREVSRDEDQSETFDLMRRSALLLLDDLGAMRETEYGAERIRLILNWRYSYQLPTIVTSDEDLEDCEPRLASRMGELSSAGESFVFELKDRDRRQE